jgi:dihydrofolate reductase
MLMRKIIFFMSVSLDGYFEGPDGKIDWIIVDEEWHRYINDQVRDKGAFLYGRRMFETMTAYWPTAEEDPAIPEYLADFARIWRRMPKIVFSRSLEKASWDARVINGNIAEEVARLKEQPGNDLLLGGPGIASAFFKLGLIDDIWLSIQPVILGDGKPLFQGIHNRLNLELKRTRTFQSGVIELCYRVEK